jgi:hypothetical protein
MKFICLYQSILIVTNTSIVSWLRIWYRFSNARKIHYQNANWVDISSESLADCENLSKLNLPIYSLYYIKVFIL